VAYLERDDDRLSFESLGGGSRGRKGRICLDATLAQERVALVLAGRPPELVEVMLWFGWELNVLI
jgi:hypothetical protein